MEQEELVGLLVKGLGGYVVGDAACRIVKAEDTEDVVVGVLEGAFGLLLVGAGKKIADEC